jgi:hypothetical protein
MLTTFEKIVLSASAIAIILGTVFANIAAEHQGNPPESSAERLYRDFMQGRNSRARSKGTSIIIEEVE